jgi:hypothetical protein
MFFSFSKPRIVSIVLLLAILVISLLFSSYSEGMTTASPTVSDAAAIINKDAPKAKTGEDAGPLSNTPIAGITDSVKPSDGIMLGSGKLLTVADITGVLQNNPGVQKMINSKSP